MKIIRLNSKNSVLPGDRCITIGAFDGLHLGHQLLIDKVNRLSKVHACIRTLVSFEPLPHEVFNVCANTARIMSLRDKFVFLKENDLVDELIIIPFRNHFLTQAADEFIRSILIKTLNVKSIVVGDDFRFGFKALGDYDLLASYADKNNFSLFKIESLCHHNVRISSTELRNTLLLSDLALAYNFLGRHFSLSGKVIHGRQLARTLGFPTLNIPLKHKVLPIRGVFNILATCDETKKIFNGVANVGFRPTVDGVTPMLEVHLHASDGCFYGKHFNVMFLNKIRDELKFSSIEELKVQIKQDVEVSCTYFLNSV